MEQKPLDPLFVITRDGEVLLFKRPLDALVNLAPKYVLEGEYVEVYALDGELLSMWVDDGTSSGRVRIGRTGRHDRAALVDRLRSLAERNGFEGDDPDPAEVANQVWANDWRVRWPRWPGWLDRRVHGDGPVSVQPRR